MTDRQQEKTDDDNDPGGSGSNRRKKEKEAIERLRAHKQKLDDWLAETEDKRGPRGNVIQSNIIDNESAKMPCAHGVVQGYNGVAAVDSEHQVIVFAEAFGSGQEVRLLEPMLQEHARTSAP